MASIATNHLIRFDNNTTTTRRRRFHINHHHHHHRFHSTLSLPSFPTSSNKNLHHHHLSPSLLHTKPLNAVAGGGAGGGNNGRRGTGDDGRRGGGGGDDSSSSPDPSSDSGGGIIGLFIEGWRSRVSADPEFPFKVAMEEVVGVSANVLGDMASRPNFGLNELDLVFSTLVVGAILNFLLMYILAATAATTSAASSSLSIFSTCPQSHMFEPGAFTVMDRLGTFVYKGAVFAVVGFAAGLVGTAISTSLVKMRKKMDPSFETANKSPPTVLNALTWAAHMGVSCNLRYQSLNGVEFVLAKTLPSLGFKTSVLVLRCLNNVMGGVTFVMLARLTGSQSQSPPQPLLLDTSGDEAHQNAGQQPPEF